MKLNVLWREGESPEPISDIGHLDRFMDNVANITPPDRLNCVLIQSSDGAELSVVLGSGETVIGWNGINGVPPYYASVGDDLGIQPVMTCFLMGTHRTEFPRKFVVPLDKGREAVREFLLTGKRPVCVEWEEV